MAAKILVCGSRNWEDERPIETVVLGAAKLGEVTLIHGGCRGADSIAWRLATKYGLAQLVFRPDWRLHGRRAGYLRNKRMLEESPDVVWAFRMPGRSPGTDMMIRLAREANVTTYVVCGDEPRA